MADLWTVMTGIHQPGPGTQYVSLSGNDSNPGTANSRKRTIQAAVDALGSAGGVVYVASGNYGSVSVSRSGGNNTSWVLVKAETQYGPTFPSFDISGTYLGIWGMLCDGGQSANCFGISNGHHLAIWCCLARTGWESGIGAAGNHSSINNVSICYNIVHNCSYWSEWAGSGIGVFQFDNNTGDVSHSWIGGYDNVIVGNISQDNKNNPAIAKTADGNGIIIDDMRNSQDYSPRQGRLYTGKFLMMGNLTLRNGGVGCHVFSSNNVDVVFNTSAHNGLTWGGASETDSNSGDNNHYIANVVKPDPPTGWFASWNSSNYSLNANVVLASSDNPGNSNRMRSNEGFNYFVNNSPTLGPTDTATAAQWVPDGGFGTIEKLTVTQEQYNAWSMFPDLLGNYRPADRNWTCGALETSPGSGGGGGGGTPTLQAAFTSSTSTPTPNQVVSFTDTSTGSPTSWSWNFGDGTTSALRNPTKSWSTSGSKTVTLTVSNGTTSSTTTATITVSGVAVPVASFTFSPSPGGVDSPVQFTDTTTGVPTSWLWTFGDGTTISDLDMPAAGLNPAGTFSGRILIDDAAPLADVLVKVVDAYHPNWVPDVIMQVLGSDGPAAGYEDYCKVTTTDANGYWSVSGLTAGRSYMLKIFPSHPVNPKCTALAVIDAKYRGVEYGFINAGGGNFASTPSAPSGETYAIYSAKGGRYLFDMPTHVYPAYGDTPLSGSQGYSDLNVRFYTRTGSFSTTEGTHSGCTPVAPTGGGTTTPGGTSTLQNPSYTYTSTGTYTVTLKATNALGNNTTTRSITIDQTPGSGGGGGGGDGQVGNGIIYQAESATLSGSSYPTDPYAMHTVTENPGYSGSGYVGFWGLSGEKVTFNLTGQTAGQATVTFRYQKADSDTATRRQLYVNGTLVSTIDFTRTASSWGANSWTDTSPIAITLASGDNTIELRHTGADYLYVDLDRMVLVPPVDPGGGGGGGGGTPTTPPVANFTRSPAGNQYTDTTITFTDTSTNTPTSWNWDFGDGVTATTQNATHAYSAPGTYTVTLQAINAGGPSTKTASITITLAPRPPVAQFVMSATKVVIDQVVTFTDQTTNTPTSWAWNFGDGSTSTLQNPVHFYSAAGTYSVSLLATNADGSSSTSKQVVVVAPPVLNPGDPEPINRYEFTVLAKRPLSLSEENDLRRMLSVLKPAQTRMHVGVLASALFDEIPIMRVAADSEWWEVTSSIVSRPGTEGLYLNPGTVTDPKEQPRPPFSVYQGEQWSYCGDIANVIAYGEDGSGGLVRDYYQRVQFSDGTFFDFSPSLGVRWTQDAITEALAIDGSMVSHPLAVEMIAGTQRHSVQVQEMRTRTSRSRSGISPVYWRGIPVEDLSERADAIFFPYRRMAGVPQRFWATPEHHKHHVMSESIEMRLRTPQRVNRAQFQLSHFPHRAWLEVWDESTSQWSELWRTTISDSVPTNLVSRVDHPDHHHPQHSMVGHWVPFQIDLEPVLGQRFRIRMQRLATGTPPLDASGREAAYSLGVKGFDLGYLIRSRIDIPRLPSATPIGNSPDPLGSRTIYNLRERTARMAIDGDSETAWMSEPQPTGQAVVNFYADVRTASGEARLIDRWYIDPIKPGPVVNLYYSNDPPPSYMTADDTPLGLGEVEGEGLFVPVADGISFDGADPAYFRVPNGIIQFDYTRDWWFGAEIETRFASPEANYAIASFEDYSIQFAQNSIVVALPVGNDIVLPLTWNNGQVIRLVVTHEEATNTISISARVGSAPIETVSQTLSYEMVGYSQHIRIGTDPSRSLKSNFVLRRLVLNQSLKVDAAAFLADPEPWIVKATYAPQDTGQTNGALLRFHPSFIDGEDFPFGLVGGPGDGFAGMTWTPIPRDFRLQKGWLEIPPTKAKFWNFEFSNLAMEPIEVQVPMRRTVKLFPQRAKPQPITMREDPAPDIPAYDAFARTWQLYSDAPEPTSEPDRSRALPTELLYAVDPAGVQRLRTATWAHGFSPWHIGSALPRFREEGQHIYDTISYEHREKVGFFVGIKELRAALTTYKGLDNNHVIVERFYNADRLTTNEWVIEPGNLTSGPSLPRPLVIESMVYPSRNRVSGLHFATQQTDAVQLLPDDNFRDPSLVDYTWSDPQRWTKVGDASVEYRRFDQQVLIRRAVSVRSTIDPLDQGLIQDPVHPVFALHQSGNVEPQDLGGIASPFVKTSPKGLLHAAARITAVTNLTNPIWVQILDEDGTVLVEEPIIAQGGDTVEWTATYNLAEYGVSANYLPNYGERTIVDEPVKLVFARETELVDQNGGPGEDTVPGYLFQVRLVQKDNSQDTWLVDRVSLFDESLIWEFSVDGGATYIPAWNVRNNPNGMLTFPKPGNALRYRATAYRANIHVSSIQIRPIYIGLPTHRFTNPHRGPNVSVYDHHPPIQDDPEFKRWNKPVPQSWWLEGQNFTSNVPIDAYPFSNEFSSTLRFETFDDLSLTFSDSVTRVSTFNRVISDTMPTVTDGVSITVTPP